ncbi:hypothetical protein [Aquirhabdus parva]|uniref:Uncharacterized protein n=1 Tax=Aquirhabdus parva TaxID=2283318 RepID=A0A345P9C7_9GAMM|nr:hypothetical protein [Aquirhabdus parva]AXI03886.1 hypothetical protein HYN46_14190 [Aquirhabdus parva]
MKRILIFSYLFIYAGVYFYDVLGFSPHAYPQSITALESKIHGCAIFFMILYVLNIGIDSRKKWFGYLALVVILIFDIFSWYYDSFLIHKFNIFIIFISTIFSLIIYAPSWVICFKLMSVKGD